MMDIHISKIGSIVAVCVLALIVSASIATAVSYNYSDDDQPIPLEVYGHVYNVKPVEIKGAQMSYDQLRAYVPTILKSLNTQYRDVEQTMNYLPRVASAYEELYDRSVFLLARRIKHFLPKADLRDIEFEVGDALRAGKWKSLVQKYKYHSASLPAQILEAQKNHNRYLAALYLAAMVDNSVEGTAYKIAVFDSIDDEEDKVEETEGIPEEKYQYGFGYDLPYEDIEPAAE